jgi:hypothetical protein
LQLRPRGPQNPEDLLFGPLQKKIAHPDKYNPLNT